jgi:UDP-N-acetylmuramate dehydrogenase
MNDFVLLQDNFGDNLKCDVILAPYTTFNIGGPAQYFYNATNPQYLIRAYDLAVKSDIRFFILGGGSNVLFADEGFAGLIIRDGTSEALIDGDTITAQSGVSYDRLVDIATEHSLTGLEFAAGIPGNVGGAVYGNAGAFGGSIADILVSAVVYDPISGVKIVDADYFKFTYRHSHLKSKFELILSVRLKLSYRGKSQIADKVNEHRRLRKAKHPDYKVQGCAGSVFKNIKEPELLPAGKLLEEAGVRGMSVGGAEIYHKHCNIIVNAGSATASDVKQLAKMMRQKVKDKFNIDLEYEILMINY